MQTFNILGSVRLREFIKVVVFDAPSASSPYHVLGDRDFDMWLEDAIKKC